MNIRQWNQWREDNPEVRIDLREADLSRANLSGAALYGVDLSGVDLYRANLYRANLYRANLSGAALRGANLREADLRGANLSGANLREADLSRTNLSEANLREANLCGVDLDFSCLPLWCGSFAMIVDFEFVQQLLYHVCKLKCDDPRFTDVVEVVRSWANEAPIIERHGLATIPSIDKGV